MLYISPQRVQWPYVAFILLVIPQTQDKRQVSLVINSATCRRSGWEMEASPHLFVTSALDGNWWSPSHPGQFRPLERNPDTLWTGGRVGVDCAETEISLLLPAIVFRSRSACNLITMLTELSCLSHIMKYTNNYCIFDMPSFQITKILQWADHI
jgi:hypothetical protein